MLIITRKKRQKIIISDEIEIEILDVHRNTVRFGIKAPKEIKIHSVVVGARSADKPTKDGDAPESGSSHLLKNPIRLGGQK